MKKRKWILACLLLTACLAGCGKKETAKGTDDSQNVSDTASIEEQTVAESSDTAEVIREDDEEELSEDAQTMITAIENTSKLTAFSLDTDMELKLKGKKFTGDIQVNSNIEVVQDLTDEEQLQMTMVTTSNQDDIVSKAFYTDGWYYTDDKNGLQKEEKTATEVMGRVTEISDLVIDGSQSIDEMTVSKTGEGTCYTYHIPEEIAEGYLNELTSSALAEDTTLSGAEIGIEDLTISSTIDDAGYLVKQEMNMTGTIKKVIFKVPAEVNVTATFQQSDKTELEMTDFTDYTLVEE